MHLTLYHGEVSIYTSFCVINSKIRTSLDLQLSIINMICDSNCSNCITIKPNSDRMVSGVVPPRGPTLLQHSRLWRNWSPKNTYCWLVTVTNSGVVNSLRSRQNWFHFADEIFKCIVFNGNVWIPVKISLKFVRKGPINNIPALVQIMDWRLDRRQAIIWTNGGHYSDAYMRHSALMS